jgi:hypothetical protein
LALASSADLCLYGDCAASEMMMRGVGLPRDWEQAAALAKRAADWGCVQG